MKLMLNKHWLFLLNKISGYFLTSTKYYRTIKTKQKLCFYFFLINDFPLILFLAINILEVILNLFIIAF